VQVTDEWLILMTSRQDLFDELEAVIEQVHPYDIPEVLAVPILDGGRNYLNWVNTVLKRRREE
jgi:periplasmic divalent cation tolerance protein